MASCLKDLPLDHKQVFMLLKEHMSNAIKGSAYNWVRPSLWATIFGQSTKEKTSMGTLTNTSSSIKTASLGKSKGSASAIAR